MEQDASLDDFEKALDALSIELNGVTHEPLRINAIGGYALLKHGIRDPETEFTIDIDSVSEEFSPEIKAAIKRVGRSHDLDDEWINTANVGEAGPQQVEELLQAKWGEADLSRPNLAISIADLPTLTRSKIAAVDTIDTNGRTKDLPDLVRLLDAQGIKTLTEFRKKYPDPFQELPLAGEMIANHYGIKKQKPVIVSHDPGLLEFSDIDFDTIDNDRDFDY